MSYQTISNKNTIIEENALLNVATSDSAPSKSTSILPKVILAGVISFISIAVLAIYHPMKVQDVSSSTTDLQDSQLSWEFSRSTSNNASIFFLFFLTVFI